MTPQFKVARRARVECVDDVGRVVEPCVGTFSDHGAANTALEAEIERLQARGQVVLSAHTDDVLLISVDGHVRHPVLLGAPVDLK